MENNTIEQCLIEKAALQRMPISGNLELLPLCNMNCEMCYVHLSYSEMKQSGKLLTPKEWLEIGRQMQEKGVLFLQITGGEPLLYPAFKEIYLGLKKLGMILTINTNGTLLDESWADFFAQNKPRRINVTLYGASPDTYRELCHYEQGLEQAVHAIRILQERNIDVKINGSLVKANAHETEKLLDIAKEWNAFINIDTYMCPASRERGNTFNRDIRLTAEEAARAQVEIQKYGLPEDAFREMAKTFLSKSEMPSSSSGLGYQIKCLAGKSSFAINWQGKMQPCVMLTTPCISVFDIGFTQAWKIFVEKVERIRISPHCMQCYRREICNVCAACSLHECGRFDGIPEYMCRYTEEKLKCIKEELGDE